MAYTTTELITDAYYLANIVSNEFETVDGHQQAQGLKATNELLGDSETDLSIIPYESTYTFNAVVGQEAYQIPNLVGVDTLTFYLDNVRYSMTYNKRNQYFGSTRVEDVTSLPYKWYFERGFGGGTLYLYFKPDEAYPVELHGTFKLASLALGQDLELTLSSFFISYLKYALAERLCDLNNFDVPRGVTKRLQYYRSIIKKNSRVLDLRLKISSTLNGNNSTGGWAFVNLARGWLPYGGG